MILPAMFNSIPQTRFSSALVFAFADIVMARNDTISHGPLSTEGPFDGARAAERWWVTG
jgi:hypothetical protein